jgi:hypothetical protein
MFYCFKKRLLIFCKGTVLTGDIRHTPTQMEAFVLAGDLCRLPVLCICVGG